MLRGFSSLIQSGIDMPGLSFMAQFDISISNVLLLPLLSLPRAPSLSLSLPVSLPVGYLFSAQTWSLITIKE